MQLNFFDGGLSTRTDPALLQPNEAVIYSNIDNSKRVLTSLRNHTSMQLEADGYIYMFSVNNSPFKLFQSFTPRDYIEYNRKLYWTEQNARAGKYIPDTDTIQELGIRAPIPVRAVDDMGFPIFDDNLAQITGLVVEFEDYEDTDFLDEVDVIEGDLAAGTYKYRIFVYNGSELVYTFDHEETVVADRAIVFTFGVPNRIKLGKLVGGVYRLIGETTISELTDNDQALGPAITDTITTETLTSQWTYTFYNSVDNIESAPAPLTTTFEWPLNKRVKLSNFSSEKLEQVDTQVDQVRVYRLSTGATSPALTGEFFIDVDTVFYDTTTNADLGRILDTYNNQVPLDGLQYLTEAYGIFFAAIDNKLYFSLPGQPDYWPAGNFISFGFIITGILPIPSGLLVFGENKTDLFVGTTAAEFARTTVSKEVGCANHKSCKLIKNVPCWINNEGVCTWQNGTAMVLSKDKLGTISLDVKNTVVEDETYWVLLNDGSVLAMDLRYGMIFKNYYADNVIEDITVYNGDLYASIGKDLKKLFSSDEYTTLKYKSPELPDGFLSMTKTYNEIYIRANGEFNIIFYIDGENVLEKELLGNKIHEVKLPAEKQRGSTIQFEITGKGKITEIEYKPVGREKNG